MEVLHSPAQLKKYMERYRIEERFATPDLQFRLLRFEKGEYLTAPCNWKDRYCFIWNIFVRRAACTA